MKHLLLRAPLLLLALAVAPLAGARTPTASSVSASAPGSASVKAKKKLKVKPRPVLLQTDDGVLTHYELRPEVGIFIDEMVIRHGFARGELLDMFSRTRYNETVARLMTPATSTRPKSWVAYRERFIEPIRIGAGVRFWNDNSAALQRATAEFGVPAEIIVGIVGVETIYGRNPGKFRVIDALSTLAFDYPSKDKDRSPFFRAQLEDYLLFARDGGLNIFDMRGSYAGAIGIPQFMPGSYRRFALDYDGDGVIDLRGNPVDAIGSVANFLREHGWVRGEAVAWPVTLPATLAPAELQRLIDLGSEPGLSPDDLRKLGINVPATVPAGQLLALIDLPNGPDLPTDYVLGTHNFNALTRYNRSYFYAMAVAGLGAAVRERVEGAGERR